MAILTDADLDFRRSVRETLDEAIQDYLDTIDDRERELADAKALHMADKKQLDTIIESLRRQLAEHETLRGRLLLELREAKRQLEPSPCGVPGHRMCDWVQCAQCQRGEVSHQQADGMCTGSYCRLCVQLSPPVDWLEQLAQLIFNNMGYDQSLQSSRRTADLFAPVIAAAIARAKADALEIASQHHPTWVRHEAGDLIEGHMKCSCGGAKADYKIPYRRVWGDHIRKLLEGRQP